MFVAPEAIKAYFRYNLGANNKSNKYVRKSFSPWEYQRKEDTIQEILPDFTNFYRMTSRSNGNCFSFIHKFIFPFCMLRFIYNINFCQVHEIHITIRIKEIVLDTFNNNKRNMFQVVIV